MEAEISLQVKGSGGGGGGTKGETIFTFINVENFKKSPALFSPPKF
jgi:hypothetical protein